jgi:hypothetical protein
VDVPDIEYEQCLRCGQILLTPESNKKVIAYVKKQEQEAIDDLPIGGFISLNEAAEILGITKQAFSKNPNIKRGLIVSKKLGQYTFYLKESVRLFKKKGNGKFLLPKYKEPEFLKHVLAVGFKKSDQNKWLDALKTEKVYTPIPQSNYTDIDLLDDNQVIH